MIDLVKSKISLMTKIMLLTLAIVILSISISSILISKAVESNIQNEVESNVLNMARVVAEIPTIIDAFEDEEPSLIIQPLIEGIRTSTEGIEYIVVTDLNGVRYSHPNPQRIGAKFVGGDEGPALLEGKEYVSTAMGTLGLSTRAFVPIYSFDGKRIGMVSVGVLNQSIKQIKNQIQIKVYVAALFGIFIGLLGSFYLAKNIKNTLMGLEPDQISALLKERNAIIEAVKEGICVIDNKGIVYLVNQAARKQLKLEGKDLIGKPIESIIPESKLTRTLKTGIPEYDQYHMVNGIEIMVNRIPIFNKGKIIGVIASFRTKTEMTKLAEELTGVKMMVDSLRANTHEFMNKMHVILGLIQLKEYDTAEKYIMDISKSQQKIISFIIKNVKEHSVAALLLGKHTASRELNIHLEIEASTHLERLTGRITSSAMITIVGNLIENAFDALRLQSGEKYVKICIREGKKNVLISVKDNGPGIRPDTIKKIFIKGYTTKEDGRGIGLYLVKQNVDVLGGKMRFGNNKGAYFIIRIPKK
ncbi:DcuS/MalK family sensor histidine kinase [Alkaliphilus peptidifermentans]|uniref:histidine kinase n=1 Tax=Alkaliphilus peptidifermentans DSM 18978 TaxID=1120976 RepID=A0A1G5K881_9FIRM|nr:sensor histidine kinase [Alkaliphilus peptidifermentans]SCY96451.1 two-component system, CitB family, sensor histidine kinase MalK [Alkaliphilus peptidifermentans DSM 18978]